jgi:hypothetical protein
MGLGVVGLGIMGLGVIGLCKVFDLCAAILAGDLSSIRAAVLLWRKVGATRQMAGQHGMNARGHSLQTVARVIGVKEQRWSAEIGLVPSSTKQGAHRIRVLALIL